MLAYFPEPYQDELLYSVIARYAIHTGQTDNQKAVIRDLFGKNSAVAIPDLPSHLNILVKNISPVWKVSANHLIKNHSLAPLYFPFLDINQAASILSSMRSSRGGNIHTRCGIAASSVSQVQYFRYCPHCCEEQSKTLGEMYWQRKHQVGGVDICLDHRCRLISSELPFHPKQKHLYQPASKTCISDKTELVELLPIETRLLTRFHELLTLNSLHGRSFNQWTLFYQNLADDIGLRQGSRVDHASIRERLFADWSKSIYKSYLPSHTENDWLINIFRKHRKSFSFLRHLMVQCSLLPQSTVKEVFKSVQKLPKDKPKEQAVEIAHIEQDNISEIRSKRKDWIKLTKKNSGGIKAIRTAGNGNAIYTWLYRHDRNWLMANRPPRHKKTVNHHKADYASWDKTNVKILKNEIRKLRNIDPRPRFTRTLLIKQLPRSNSVEKHLQELPETNKWLESNAESLEDYQIYRIKKAARSLLDQHLPIKEWRLLRIAGIRSTAITIRIKKQIEELEEKGSC